MLRRREFLSRAAAGGTLAALPSLAYAAPATKPRRVGLIGCGWYGKVDLLRLIQVEPVEVVSLCDVDSVMLDNAAQIVASRQVSKKEPRKYGDWQKMLADKDLDICLVGTPDHWHALPTIAAIQNGADVYVQNPVGVDVLEGEAMLAAARKHDRVVQVGTQRRSTPHLIDARDKVIREGLLGTIGHVEICCYYHMRLKGNPPNEAPPETLDWEMWTGPAPMRPFDPAIHPRRWRGFMAYGNGIVGDMCVHMLDMVRWALDLGWPKSVSSTGGILVDKQSIADISDTQTATFDFDGMPVVWTHRSWGNAPDPQYPWAAFIYGDKGTLKMSVNGFDFVPHGSGNPIHQDVVFELEEYPEDKTEKDLEQHVAPAVRKHMRDFLDAIDNRTKPVADIEQGHISSASCILANLSMDLGRSLAYDPATRTIPGDEEATAALARAYRDPWKHPTPEGV
jgi:predicted dehydrogenase